MADSLAHHDASRRWPAFTSGLDNAGKTTILKKLNDEDIRTVSPTLGFEIKTFAHKG